jgi:ribosomal protein S12 methylthiotransferase
MVTLGCARNEVDSEELAGRLATAGWDLTRDPARAAVVLVNTCGFIESAKQESIDTVLAAADTGRPVVAVGCLAERYGAELAAALPEADAVLGFDAYETIASTLDEVIAGRAVVAHQPRDRRKLLPVVPALRPAAADHVAVPGHAWVPGLRQRLDDSPVGYLKIASGCDRRCTFCAIPSFRGAFVSRPPEQLLAEARWLASTGVQELVLISENSTSYGKDRKDLGALERLLPKLAAIDGIIRVRLSYLQPAELRPSVISAIAQTPGVAPYFDLSFQHASPAILRQMRRFGSTDAFLDLLSRIRSAAPAAGARSNVIVGFPGETERDLDELITFLAAARLDAVGVFGFSAEDGTAAATMPGQLSPAAIAERVSHIAELADELVSQRAEERIGERVDVLVEHATRRVVTGRAAHQGPDGDGTTTLRLDSDRAPVYAGALCPLVVVGTDGVDLIARAVP